MLRDADLRWGLSYETHGDFTASAMSEEQLSALLAKLKEDAGLKEKFQGAADFETFVAMAKEAGLTVNQTDWLTYQAKQTPELNDAELETIAGGYNQPGYTEGQECATKYCDF